MMNDVLLPGDVVTRYEYLVDKPRDEITRIAEHLSIDLGETASEVPERPTDNFSLARYLLRRSPARDRVLQAIAPIAQQLRYPETSPGSLPDGYLLAARYFLTWLKRPSRLPPYGYPTLQRLKKMAREK